MQAAARKDEYSSDEKEKDDSEQQALLEKIGLALAKIRHEAIEGRQKSGIETEWAEDEEHYHGIDDANRGEMSAYGHLWREKPPGQAGFDHSKNTGSTVFINITQQYCDGVAARISDMLLPTDDRGWEINPTPIPELANFAKGKVPRSVQRQIRDRYIDEANHKYAGQNLPVKQVAQVNQEIDLNAQEEQQRLINHAKEEIEIAKEAAEKAQTRIEDWHVECQYHAEVRKVIEDVSRVGSGVLKGPVPQKTNKVAYINGELVLNEEIQPGSLRIDVWNLFPDPGCGNNIHNGSYIFERDDITKKQLMDLYGLDGYNNAAIMKVIKEGPHVAGTVWENNERDMMGLQERDISNLYEIWYYYGILEKADLEAAGYNQFDDDDEGEDGPYHAQVTMINNTVIKAVLNPLDTGKFPYDVMVFKARTGMPWGTGVSRQIRTPQRIVNGAARNMMDNAAIAGGPMWIYKHGMVKPIDGVIELRSRKGWIASEDANIKDVNKAISFINIDMKQAELQAIIFLGMKLAEDVVGLPMIMQGQMGQTTPDRVGVVNILNQNASTVLRRIARLFDDLLTEPHIRRYYDHLLQHGEDDSEKGDFSIDARGSSALVEKAVQSEKLQGMAGIVVDPRFGLDPKKWAKQLLRSQQFDPKNFEFDDEQWQQIVEQLSQPPQENDPRLEIAGMKQQTDMEKIASTERMQEKDQQFAAAMKEFDVAVEEEFKLLEEQGKDNISKDRFKEVIERIKGDLTKTVITINAQKDLARSNVKAPQVARPIAEPPGRAKEGKAFQQ